MYRWFGLLLLLTSCSGYPSIPADAAFFTEMDVGTPEFICDTETDVQTNFNHCGACGHPCSAADADLCEYGICRCGSTLPCSTGEDCRSGTCVPVDLDGRVCEFDHDCLIGYACIEAHCSFVACVPEACDGYDNDCDGLIDNQGSSPLSQWCSGDMETSPAGILPPCTPGVRSCLLGSWTECIGDTPPIPETGWLACDGIDNDCNGCIDGEINPETLVCAPGAASSFDVVFALDVSSSMADSIQIVSQASNLFAGRLASADVEYAVVEIPGVVDGVPAVLSDLSDLTTLRTTLLALGLHGASEPQIDAVYGLGTGDLELSWRPEAVRIILLFTDEYPQSVLGLSESDMCDALTHGESLVVIAPPMFSSGLGGPPGAECAFGVLDLPIGRPGLTRPCTTGSDCSAGDLCFESVCVSAVVRDLVLDLETVITDPCG